MTGHTVLLSHVSGSRHMNGLLIHSRMTAVTTAHQQHMALTTLMSPVRATLNVDLPMKRTVIVLRKGYLSMAHVKTL